MTSSNNHSQNDGGIDTTQEGLTVIDAAQNCFGEELQVVEAKGARFICCSGVVHGGFFRFADGTLSNTSISAITNTSLLGAVMQIQKKRTAQAPISMLFAGLSSGSTPVSHLMMDESIEITVVEIDKKTIDLTRQHFPMVPLLEETGRLRIIHDDFFAWIQREGEKNAFDMTFLDLFVNQFIFSDLYSQEALKRIRAISQSIWLNHIGQIHVDQRFERLDVFLEAGIDFKTVFSKRKIDEKLGEPIALINNLFTTDTFDDIALDDPVKSLLKQLSARVENGLPICEHYYPFYSEKGTVLKEEKRLSMEFLKQATL